MAQAYTFRRKRTWHHAWSRVGHCVRHVSGLSFDVVEEPVQARVQVHSLMQYLQREHDNWLSFCEIGAAYERLTNEAQVWVERNWRGQWNPRTKQHRPPSTQTA